MEKIIKTEAEWKKELTPDEYKIMREKGTEPPFSGRLIKEKGAGMYVCAACGNELFSSETKYDSGTGWPSFYDLVSAGAAELRPDTSGGARRCNAHSASLTTFLRIASMVIPPSSVIGQASLFPPEAIIHTSTWPVWRTTARASGAVRLVM